MVRDDGTPRHTIPNATIIVCAGAGLLIWSVLFGLASMIWEIL